MNAVHESNCRRGTRLTGLFAHRWSTKCERHANAGYEAAMARLAGVELDPRIPLDDEAGPRLRVAHYAQILAYFGMKPPVPEPPPVDMRRRNTLRVLESGAASDAAPAVDHRAKLVAFYEKHNPAKLDSIDATLAKYAGRESELFEALRAKYEAPAAVEEKVDAPDAPAPAASAPAPATPALPA